MSSVREARNKDQQKQTNLKPVSSYPCVRHTIIQLRNKKTASPENSVEESC